MPEEKKNDIEDMFAEVDGDNITNIQNPSRAINEIPPKQVSTPSSPLPQGKLSTKSTKGKIIWLIIMAVIVICLVLGGVLIYWQYFRLDNNISNVNDYNIINSTNYNTINNTNNSAILDTDGDGLTDEEEIVYGTEITNPDTDFDGLSDLGEKVFQTDPHSKDTDGDGYNDGAEIKNGYNPNGPGKLLNLNQALNNINS